MFKDVEIWNEYFILKNTAGIWLHPQADISDLVSQPQCGIKKTTKAREGCPLYQGPGIFEDPLWFMHKRHSLQVEGARGGGIPQLQISASKYEVADAPNPPTPQICAHQKSKNWRRSPCSVYCKPSLKNLRQLEMKYMKRWKRKPAKNFIQEQQ